MRRQDERDSIVAFEPPWHSLSDCLDLPSAMRYGVFASYGLMLEVYLTTMCRPGLIFLKMSLCVVGIILIEMSERVRVKSELLSEQRDRPE